VRVIEEQAGTIGRGQQIACRPRNPDIAQPRTPGTPNDNLESGALGHEFTDRFRGHEVFVGQPARIDIGAIGQSPTDDAAQASGPGVEDAGARIPRAGNILDKRAEAQTNPPGERRGRRDPRLSGSFRNGD